MSNSNFREYLGGKIDSNFPEITVEDLQRIVQENNITAWSFRECFICEFPLFFLFCKNKVFFDSSCNCVSISTEPEERTWNTLINIFNMQLPEIRKRMLEHFAKNEIGVPY